MSRRGGQIILAAIFLILTGRLAQAASGNQSKKLSDMSVGQVVQVGSVKFVKTASNQLVATSLCPQGSTYSSYFKGCVVKTTTFDYTGDYQTFTVPATGPYVVELWGAQGGDSTYGTSCTFSQGGRGSYIFGLAEMSHGEKYYLYIGGAGQVEPNTTAFNGGGTNHPISSGSFRGTGGGGATDIRMVSGTWSDGNSLMSRIAVAAGGGGSNCYNNVSTNPIPFGGNGGGLSGYDGLIGSVTNDYDRFLPPAIATAGTQVSGGDKNGSYGSGGRVIGNTEWGGGGGGGWYGGGSGGVTTHRVGSGAGGSSYISGHIGCVAVTSLTDTTPKAGCDTGTTDRDCSLSPTGYSFTDTVMIDGAGYSWTNTKGALTPMPDPTSVGSYYDAGVGHTGNGAARITQLSVYLGI